MKFDSPEFAAMKFAMYEVIELFRAPYGVRANVAVKILLLSLIAIPSKLTQHARLIQRLNLNFRKQGTYE